MKKLEKLGSKLFEEFKGDEVSELASVVGGIYTKTKDKEGCEDTYKSDNRRDVFRGNQSDEVRDLIHSTLKQDEGTVAYSGGSSILSGFGGTSLTVSGGSFSSYFLG